MRKLVTEADRLVASQSEIVQREEELLVRARSIAREFESRLRKLLEGNTEESRGPTLHSRPGHALGPRG